jgi:hypothetical protein
MSEIELLKEKISLFFVVEIAEEMRSDQWVGLSGSR